VRKRISLPGSPRQPPVLWWCNPCSAPIRTLPRSDMSPSTVFNVLFERREAL
jgi:hypothetical protein